MIKKYFGIKIFCILLFSVALGYSSDNLTEVSFCPQYIPQAQFAGYYMAKEKGFYEEKGLDVNIDTYQSTGYVTEGLNTGELDFGTYFLSSAITEKSLDVDIVNIGQTSKQSSMMLIAKKSSGISKLEDIKNKKIGVWTNDFNVLYRAFNNKYNLNAKIIPVFSGIQLFLNDGVDMMAAMQFNEYHTLINSGYNKDELVTFYLKDYSFDVPEDGIYCLKETWKNQPKICGKFVEASMEGWYYAFNNPEETIDIVINYMESAHIPANRAHQKWMLSTMQKLIFPQNNMKMSTKLSKQDFIKTRELLKNNGYLKNSVKFENFYKGAGKYAGE